MSITTFLRPIMFGALGALSPYLVASWIAIFISPYYPSTASDIAEVTGILGTLACIPTILFGSIMGWGCIWLITKLEKPKPIFLKIEESASSRWISFMAFLGGLLTGPILGLLAVFASAWAGML